MPRPSPVAAGSRPTARLTAAGRPQQTINNQTTMEKTSDNYSCLSSQRGRLMGAAMLMVVLFHVGGMRHDTFFYCLSRCGNVGVDVFLYLSGIGLWFSWGKIIGKKHAAPTATGTRPAPRNASGRRGKRLLQAIAGSPYATFLRRRYVRVYPAWLIVAAAYYLPRCLDGRASAADTALSIAVNWGFWQHDELTFWFIPAIMALYTVAPAYIELIRRHAECRWMPVAAMVLCVLVQYWAPLHSVVGHLEIFFSRIPIFLIGINTGLLVEQRRHIGRAGWWMLIGMLAVCTLACVNFEDGLRGRFPLFLERMVYIPLTVSMALLMARALAHAPAWAGSVLAFIGGISLEIYLIHAQFVLLPLQPLRLGYWPTALAVVAISAAPAWLLHKGISLLTRKIA